MTDASTQAPPAAPSNPAGGSYPMGFCKPPCILLVDDEANILSALKRLLRPQGYQVLSAEGGESALTILAQESVDLIISDMRMPIMDGATLLAQVREHWPGTLRVLLTGYADISSTISAINKGGIFRYIAKPWNDEEILGVISQALEIRGLALERQRLQELTEKQNAELNALNLSLEEKVRERTGELQSAHQELTLGHEKLKNSFFGTVQMLSNLIELREPSLAGHSRRVAGVAKKIAEKLGLSAGLVNDVLLAGLLHDIGKIGYSDDLMLTPMSKMTGEGLSVARKHPITGATALMAIPDMRGVAEIIRSHHERWDGTGFPDGLSGQAIPFGARILAIANDFDAAQIGTLSTKKMSADEAKQYIIEGRNFRYDPTALDAFAELVGRARPAPVPEKRISSSEVEVGMVLTRDLYSPDGVLLLAIEYVLDEALVKQLREQELVFGKPLQLCVRA